MTQITEQGLSEQEQQRRQKTADLERTAESLFWRSMTMLTKINEEMVMNDRSQAMARSNIARACTEAAAYAKREAAALRNSFPTE